MIEHVVEGLVARICVGLNDACASLDADAASEMMRRLGAADSAIGLLENETHSADWFRALARLSLREGLHGLVAGRACHLLFDAGKLDATAVAQRMSVALSRGNDPRDAGAWLEGFLQGSGMLLLHDEKLWSILDAWVAGLSEAAFTAILPILRRAFANFSPPERRMMGERARERSGPASGIVASAEPGINHERAARILPILETLLGLEGGAA